MKLRLKQSSSDGSIATLCATLPPLSTASLLWYRTRTGGLLRIDGVAAGAYDREHHDVLVAAAARERELQLEVELQALPTNGLPSGGGLIWWWLNARAHEKPRTAVAVAEYRAERSPAGENAGGLALIGHSHLDVAWLWSYEETRRKAERTIAIACDLLERDQNFVFIQSQPQLYRFVEKNDPQLFGRVRELIAKERFDPDVAALWVESDCNLPSGESLLRQMLFAHRYCRERFGTEPSIAWLPDSFGFANTIPQLLAHAGISFFATTKLQWNDTTRFPYPQFVWKGPDGSSVVSALIQSYDGAAYPWRVRTARARNEPLVLGYGDGGGGVTPQMLSQARRLGRWIHPRQWFAQLQARRDALPVHDDELYLEYHRGVYTTHHDVKFHNALLERALSEAEELLAWCYAVRAPVPAIERLCGELDNVWEIVLRNQFHDVLPGTSIAAVYEDVAAEYAQAEAALVKVMTSCEAMLPRASRSTPERAPVVQHGAHYVLDNDVIRARIDANGTIVQLTCAAAANSCIEANVLALYRDKPRQWEAWNIDDGYQRSMQRLTPTNCVVENDGLTLDFPFIGATMRIELIRGEPFVRITVAVDWRLRRKLLRVENWFALSAQTATYGTPHGAVRRSALRDTPQERGKFEVPGQRFAAAFNEPPDKDGAYAGIAMFALDTYGWSARAEDGSRGENPALALGHSLLRGTTWPDPGADRGEHFLSYAFAPLAGASIGEIEHMWLRFAHEPRVRLFTCSDPAVLVVCCKPAGEGAGVIIRLRECDGAARNVRLRCGARMTKAECVDALERPIAGEISLQDEELIFDLAAFQLRSFRVQFT